MNKDRTILADKPWAKNLGWVIAVISLCLTVYTSFFFQKSSCLEYEIVSNTSILNENVELSSIRIMVDSVDVKQNNANVSIVEIKVANTGRSHLRREDYDRSEFGLKVENGYMIGCPEFTASSSDHLRICVKSHDFISDSSFINMPVLPLDSKDFYQLRCVFLHGNDADIGFIPYGKIIGQRDIKVIDSAVTEESFMSKLLYGNFWIHLLRFVVYLMLLVSVIMVFSSIDDAIDKRKKRKFVQELYAGKAIDKRVIADYDKGGYTLLWDINQIMKLGEKNLIKKYEASSKFLSSQGAFNDYEHWKFHTRRIELFDHMLNNGYLTKNEDAIVINWKKRKSLLALLGLLQKRGLTVTDIRRPDIDGFNYDLLYEREN